MSGITVNKNYIENLQYTNADIVKNVGIMPFIKGLEKTFTKEKTTQVMQWLISTKSTSSNLNEFQARIIGALSQNGSINGADQVYIADLIKSVSLGRYKLV